MTNEVQNMQQPEEEGFKLEDFGMILLSHWYWIVFSVAIALGIAILKVRQTTPQYTRSLSMLIKTNDQSGGGASFMAQEFEDMGLFRSNTNINNEILTISSPSLMEEVIKKLHIDVRLSVENGLHQVPLYTDSPIRLLFPQADDKLFCSFKMKLNKNQTAELWDFKAITKDGEQEYTQHVKVAANTLAKTPVGIVVIQPTDKWKQHFTDEIIQVRKLPLTNVAGMYAARLNVTRSGKESTILDLTLTDESQQRADDVLLKLIDVYNEQWLKDRNRMAESTFTFITERLDALSKELGDVDQQISDYKSNALLPDVDAASAMYMSESAKNNDQIITLNNQLSIARYIKDYLNDRTKQNQYLPSNTGIGSTGIEEMITNYNKTVNTRNEVLNNSDESSPLAQNLAQELTRQKASIMHSLENLIVQLQSQVRSWEATEAKTNQKLATAPRQVKQLLSIGRQQKVKEALYIYLLQKREENELSKTFTAWNTRIIQQPHGSDAPTSPQKGMAMLIALGVGIFIPAGLLFLREFLDHTVRGRKDLDNMHVPLLGEIPELEQNKHHWWQRSKHNATRAVYIKENCRDLINESFRNLRTKLDYFMNSTGADKKVIMLTSFNPGSGKSFISLNLSKVLSLKGKRVLTIDFDLRRCSLSQVIGSPKRGITEYLSGMTSDIHELIKVNALGTDADVLPVGIVPPNPTELLLNDQLATLLQQLRSEYDYIILDCPPIEVVADTNIIKKYADVSLFIVRAGLMDRRLLKEVDGLYTENTYSHMAILLNGTKYVSSRYSNYRYGYAYGYSYGYGYHDKS